MTENKKAKKAEDMGKEFMETVQLMKEDLKEIKTCEKLKDESPEADDENSVSQLEDFQRILRRVSELDKVFTVALTMMGIIGEILRLIVSIFTVTTSPEEEKSLTDASQQISVRRSLTSLMR